MLLEGKTILITGASRGIGRSVAQLCAKEGARVLLLGRNQASLEEVKKTLPVHKKGHLIYVQDLNDLSGIKKLFEHFKGEKIFIDCLVNNAGIMQSGTLMVSKSEMISNTFLTNVFAPIELCKFSVSSMLRKKGGSIINISSIIATQGVAGKSVYGASKAALVGLTKSLSKELAPLNIRVNAISPGIVDTDLIKDLSSKELDHTINNIGMKRIGEPEDVAKVVLFFASELSGYVTGQIIGVDGGMIV